MGDPNSSLVSGVLVYQDSLNTSTHFPVKCVIPPVVRGTSGDQPSGAPVRRRVLWTKLDKPKYRRILSTELNPGCLKGLPLGEVAVQLSSFSSILVEAAVECTAKVKPGKKKRLWSSELQRAAADSKKTHFQWKQAGKPGPEHSLSVQRRVSKKQLHTLQRQQHSEYRSSIYNDIRMRIHRTGSSSTL